MPSIVSTMMDALAAKCQAAWPTAKQIANANAIEMASSIFLADGFGIAVGPSEPSLNDLSCQERFTRQMLIVRTISCPATEMDVTRFSDTQKSMLEQHFALRRALRTDNTLGGVISDLAYGGDGGIEFIQTANQAGRFYVLSSLYTATYIENLY